MFSPWALLVLSLRLPLSFMAFVAEPGAFKAVDYGLNIDCSFLLGEQLGEIDSDGCVSALGNRTYS